MTPPRDLDPAPGGGAAAGLASALRSVADLLDQDPATVPGDVLRAAVCSLHGLSGQIDWLLTSWVGAFDAQTVWAGDGARSAAGWIAGRTESSRPAAAGVVHRARALRACPHVDAAYSEGRLGTAKVRLLLHAQAVDEDRFAEHEADLVALVEPLTVAQAQVALARWEALAQAAKDLETGADEPDDPAQRNSFHLSKTLDGRWIGDLDLDAVAGEAVANAVAAVIDRQFQTGAASADDGIGLPQRRADALCELVARGADESATRHGDPRPSVSVTIDHDTLVGRPVDDLDDAMRRRCETDDGTPLGRPTIERLLCTARVQEHVIRILRDGTIETLGITDVLRDATRQQRRALRRRDRGCVFPGCTAPPEWCEAHHLIPYEIGGKTLLINLVLLCSHHHHLVHEGGWRLWRSRADGGLRLVDPHGRPHAVPRRGTKVPLHPPPLTEDPPPPLPLPAHFRARAA